MIVYRYDKDTKEFIGIQNAQKDPLGDGYLLPANCTFKEVPDKIDGYIQVYINEEWKQEADHRKHYEVNLNNLTFDIVNYIGTAKPGYEFVTDEVYNNFQADPDRYKVEDSHLVDIIDTEEYRKIKEAKEKERISHLKCTKRVLALMLQQLGISYNQLKALIATNEQAQLEWDLCIELERSNPLLDIMGQQLGLSPQQIDMIFKVANNENTKYANGEVETLEVQ